jgi:dUTP pyrophosphatase
MIEFVCRLCGHREWRPIILQKEVFQCEGCSVIFSDIGSFTLPSVKVLRLSDNAIIPTKATDGSVAYDLYSAYKYIVEVGKTVMVRTDIAIGLPPNHEAQVRPRSGNAKKKGLMVVHSPMAIDLDLMIANKPGTVDTDYIGNIGVLLFNNGSSSQDQHITAGQRIAQLLITPKLPYRLNETQELKETERSDGGFGHSGD